MYIEKPVTAVKERGNAAGYLRVPAPAVMGSVNAVPHQNLHATVAMVLGKSGDDDMNIMFKMNPVCLTLHIEFVCRPLQH